MTAVSDETGRGALQRCPEGCVEYQARRSNNPFLNCGRCGTRMVQVLPAAAPSAAPVAQEPVARLVPIKNLVAMLALLPPAPVDVNGEQFAYHDPNAAKRLLELRSVFDALIAASPLYTSPPATSAGVGAEEIAPLLEEARDMLMERIYGNPARSPGHNARLQIEKAIALLSRGSGSDQQRSHEA